MSDRNSRVESANVDQEYIKENGDKMKEDEETYIDEQFKLLDDDDIDEDLKNVMTTKFRLDHISKSF